ncbi:MAG: dockerin type I domain-containing protein [Planctomycetota bacterium]
MTRFQTTASLLCGLGAVTVGVSAHAANAVPFVETFSDVDGNLDGFDFGTFVDDTLGYNFAVNGATDTFDVTLLDGARSYSTVETSGVPTVAGTELTIRTDFTLTEAQLGPGIFDTATTRLGFSLFGSDGGNVEQSGADPLSYSAYISEPGGFSTPSFILRNVETGASVVSDPFTTFTSALIGTDFDFQVDITLTATSMIADYTLTDLNTPALVETGSVELIYTDPLLEAPTGTYFGYHIDKNNGGLPSTISFDDFSLSVATTTAVDGDANGDGDVDLLDFDILAGNFGAGPGAVGGESIGDFNGDGNVDLLDFDILAGNFGFTSPSAVPEPASAAVLGLAGAALLRRRRA